MEIQDTRRIVLTNVRNALAKTNYALIYVSGMCFFMLVAFVSFSVNRFVNDTLSISLSTPEEDLEPQNRVEIFVKKGDTLSKILYAQNIPVLEVQNILDATTKLEKNITLHLGQKITFDYDFSIQDLDKDDLIVETPTLKRLSISLDKTNSLEILKTNGGFIATKLEIPLKKLWYKSSALVKTNFMSAARSLGVSSNNVVDLVNIYSHQIDFQRQIKPGDNLDLIVEKFVTEDGQFSHYGKVVFASLKLSGKTHNVYRYTNDTHDKMQYFTEDGKSVKRNLLRTPIGVAKISSHFGKRKHPILGYTKMHKGVDFFAPKGTPIYAAGNGIVTEAGWKTGFGNYVQIRHSGTLSTAYGHANSFAKGLKRGNTVKQGQVIAYVGQTGRATGPHLHYEVKINGQQVNPLSIKTSPGIELGGKKLLEFASFKQRIHKIHADLDKTPEIAVE
jgi:murein DD-endopeptidase MepM/ murein hydrolase activator NlpD